VSSRLLVSTRSFSRSPVTQEQPVNCEPDVRDPEVNTGGGEPEGICPKPCGSSPIIPKMTSDARKAVICAMNDVSGLGSSRGLLLAPVRRLTKRPTFGRDTAGSDTLPRLGEERMPKPLIFLVLLGLWPWQSFACSCFVASPCFPLEREGAEFLGKVIRIGAAHPLAEDVTIEFSVSETFGTMAPVRTVTVQTPAQSTACAYPFQSGREYFVSATAHEGRLWTSKCSRTQPAATAFLRQLRARKAGQPTAQIFGYVGVEPYPGVSPLSRLSSRPVGALSLTAHGAAGRFVTATKPDGSFAFVGLPASRYSLQVQLPPDLLIWFAGSVLERQYEVRPGVACEVDIALYPKGDPMGR
jgi:hypothetical protein